MEGVLTKGGEGGVKVSRRRICFLIYADDVVLLAEDERNMRVMLRKLERYTGEK